MIYFRNVDETMSKLKHDLTVVGSQKDALQAALTEAANAKKKADEKVKALSTESKTNFDSQMKMWIDERRLLTRQLEDAHTKLSQEKTQRRVRFV